MGRFEQLERRYRDEGYQVYSRHLPHLAAVPLDWRGAFPDVVVEKDGNRTAIFCETKEALLHPLTPSRWRQALENGNTQLKLLLSQNSDFNLAREMLEQEVIIADVALLRREGFKRRKLLSKRSVIILLLVLLVSLAVIWFGAYLYDYDPIFHEPRDFERERNLQSE